MLKRILYKTIRKIFFPLLSYSFIGIKIRWIIGLYLIETSYFNDFLTDKSEKFYDRLDPEKKIQDYLEELLKDISGGKIKILDVGAGPITRIGYKLDDKIIEIYPIDPLAKVYCRILQKKKIHVPVKTIIGKAEKLSLQFHENEFDLVYAHNCIDHTANPVKALNEIHQVLKPDHYLYFMHFINEGEQNNYYGLHQWNFYYRNDNLYLSNKTRKIDINISDVFKYKFHIEINIIKRRIIGKFRKLKRSSDAVV